MNFLSELATVIPPEDSGFSSDSMGAKERSPLASLEAGIEQDGLKRKHVRDEDESSVTAFRSNDLIEAFVIPRTKSASAPRDKFITLHKWQCFVEDIRREEGVFIGRIQDGPARSNSDDHVMEFPFDDVAEDDLPLVREGAVFLWYVGRAISVSGQTTRGSRVIFRRLPVWTDEDKEESRREAKRIAKRLRWE